MAALGFDGAVFLEEHEYRTYMKRMPVRYIKKTHSSVCKHCGSAGTADNPLEHAHLVGFQQGIVKFALTPDWLDSKENIVSAHKRICNKAVELPDAAVKQLLLSKGLAVPSYAAYKE
jgi:hypothetical protein